MKAYILFALCLLTFGVNSLGAEGGSAANRKKLYLQTEIHMGGNGEGGGVGLFLPGDCRLDLSYSEQSASLLGASAEIRMYRVEIQSFVANSFYYSLGAVQRKMNLRVHEYFSDEFMYQTDLKTTGPYMVIGNEWQWDHFFIGAEWVGVSRPITWEYTNNYGEAITDEEKLAWEKDLERAAKRDAGIALNLFVGFSF